MTMTIPRNILNPSFLFLLRIIKRRVSPNHHKSTPLSTASWRHHPWPHLYTQLHVSILPLFTQPSISTKNKNKLNTTLVLYLFILLLLQITVIGVIYGGARERWSVRAAANDSGVEDDTQLVEFLLSDLFADHY